MNFHFRMLMRRIGGIPPGVPYLIPRAAAAVCLSVSAVHFAFALPSPRKLDGLALPAEASTGRSMGNY